MDFYVSTFGDAKIISTEYYPESEEEGLADFQRALAGKPVSIDYELWGTRFVAINAGPEFTPNPSINFTLNFDPLHFGSDEAAARTKLDELWAKLAEGGTILMPLQEYPFSKHYGWVSDRYNVSWQLILTDPEGKEEPPIIPGFMFVGEHCGKAEEAMHFYTSVFKDAHIEESDIFRYQKGMAPDTEGTIAHAVFTLEGQRFITMDSAREHAFNFNEGVSLMVYCDDQAEIDYYWNALAVDPQEGQCGWIKDTYGVSWQIVPKNMNELMKRPCAFKTLMGQKKIIIAEY